MAEGEQIDRLRATLLQHQPTAHAESRVSAKLVTGILARMPYAPNDLLSRLVGRNLATVVFLRWYLQLTFDGPFLNCDAWPTVNLGNGEVCYGDMGYRDALCSLLSEAVVATEERTGIGLLIEMESGTIRIHPSVDDLEGPEIAMLSGFEDGSWMVWRPGEDSFEDLA